MTAMDTTVTPSIRAMKQDIAWQVSQVKGQLCRAGDSILLGQIQQGLLLLDVLGPMLEELKSQAKRLEFITQR